MDLEERLLVIGSQLRLTLSLILAEDARIETKHKENKMARKAIGSGNGSSAASMADRRDMGNVADLMRVRLHEFLWPRSKDMVDQPGARRRELRVDGSTADGLLSDWGQVFADVLYGDFLAPGLGTPYRVRELSGLADDIASSSDDKQVKSRFRRLSKRMMTAAATIEQSILLEAGTDTLLYRLFDLVHYLSDNAGLDFRGLIPAPIAETLVRRV